MKTGLIVALLLSLLACGQSTESDPTFCSASVDCNRPEELGSKDFCDIDGVYPSSALPSSCIERPDANACNRVEPCAADSERPYCDDEAVGATGTCVECVTGSQCEKGEICDESQACVAFTCSPGVSGDAACVAADATLPYCGAGDVCAECLDSTYCSDASKSICDATELVCRGCEANDECTSGVCDMESAACVSEQNIVYVAVGGSAGGCGSQATPCPTIMLGLAEVSGSRRTVLVGAGEYAERVVSSSVNASLVADGTVVIGPDLSGSESAVEVSGTASLRFDGFTVRPAAAGADTDGASCTGSTATLMLRDSTVTGARDEGIINESCDLSVTGTTVSDNGGIGITSSGGSLSVTGTTVSDNGGIGITSSGGSLSVTGTTIIGNDGGGLDIENADFTVTNNVIAFNGSNNVLHSGVEISSTATTHVFDFNTVVGNQVLSGVSGVTCSTGEATIASGNIVYDGVGGTAVAGTCTWQYSDIEGGQAGTGNINLPPKLVNSSPASGDFHLASDSPCIDAADPAAALATDIDGDMRPAGTAHDMGAYERQ